jgi:hypothetical protein
LPDTSKKQYKPLMTDNIKSGSLRQRLSKGEYALAIKYWSLYWAMAIAFFIAGSLAVTREAWQAYLIMLALTVGWTFVLLVGIKRAYTGEDPGKALSRIAILFLLLNMTNALATLSFI